MTTGQRTTLDALPLKEGGVPAADDNIWLGPNRVKVSGLAAAIKSIIGYTTDYGTLPAGTEVQLRRGTTAQNNTFTGKVGELTHDTQAKRLRLHDGATAGGSQVAMMADLQGMSARQVYPQDHGAVADGVVDDSAAFTSAAAASGTVWLSGKYKATGSFGTSSSNWVITPGTELSDTCILLGRVRKAAGSTRNMFINGSMVFNQRNGQIDEIGRYQVLSRPYRFDSTSQYLVKPDGSYEDLAFVRGVTLDRWFVYINYLGQTGGAGFVEQVRCIDAPAWATGTAYAEGDLRRAPAGQYGDGYVYRCIAAHTSGTWNTDVKTAINPSSWEALPRYWALYGLYETDPALQNKFALRWKQTAPSSAGIWLEQRILGVNWVNAGRYSLSFLAKNRDAANVPVRAFTLQEMGVGQTDYTSSSATQNITVAAAVQKHTVTLTDPKSSRASGFAGNNRMESVQVRIDFPTVGQTFDLLITDVQFEEGERTSFVPEIWEDGISRCQAYYFHSNPPWFPARCANYVADSIGGVPQWNVLPVDQLWDRYGLINNASSGESINWGGTNRAFLNNERETPGIGKVKRIVDYQAKAWPEIGRISFPVEMIRPPTVKIYDCIGAQEGYATCNERFKASLRFDYTGVGATARPFAQRSLAKIATFFASRNAMELHTQNFDPNTIWEDFSVPVTIPGGQDAIGTAFLTIFGGYKYDWDWTASASGTGVYYLHLANTQYYKLGAGSLQTINAWAAGPFAVGDVVQISGTKRYYECMVAHTGTVAPDDNDVRWRPYGRITFPHRIRFDGATVAERSAIANPSSLAVGQWYFGDNDSLGFKTLYVRMASGAADPGSAAGRLHAQSYDQNLDLRESLLMQFECDAEIFTI